jgi:hypothetical protein
MWFFNTVRTNINRLRISRRFDKEARLGFPYAESDLEMSKRPRFFSSTISLTVFPNFRKRVGLHVNNKVNNKVQCCII